MADLSQLDDWGCIPQSLRKIWKRKFSDPLIAVRKRELGLVWWLQIILLIFCITGACVLVAFAQTNEVGRGNWFITLPGILSFFSTLLSFCSLTALSTTVIERKSAREFLTVLNCLYETLEITPTRFANLTSHDIEDLVLWTLLRRAKQIKALEAKDERDAAKILERDYFAYLHQVAFDLGFWDEEKWNKIFQIAQEESEVFKNCRQTMETRMPDLYPEPHAREPEASSDPAS
ncbi:MAG: hypothetical protein AAB364_01360 [Patescibacteria group bacterium]